MAIKGKYYVSGCMPGKLETTMDVTKAMIFSGMDEARYRIDPYFLRDMRFMKAETVKARMGWRFCIRVQGGSRDGMYMERLTRSRFHMTCRQESARRFPDRMTAERYIEKRLKGRFSVPGFSVYEIQQNGGEARA